MRNYILKKRAFLILCILTFASVRSLSQTIIASEDFENSLTLFSKTGPGTFYTGFSGAFHQPFNSPFAVSNSYAYGLPGGLDTLTSSIINTSAYSSVFLTLRLASFSTNLSGGNDINDNVRIEISPDDGLHYYPTVQVTGNLNAWWSYAGGTGNASTIYDGDPALVTFSPAGGGNRTADGYSIITITSLPESMKLRARIILRNDASSGELWVIDKFEVKGNAVVGPLITIYPLALPNFYTVTGIASAEQTYQVSGSSLTNDIAINSPTGYEISITSGTGFGTSVTLTQNAGVVPATTIYARLNAVTTGSYNGNLVNTSTGATARNVVVTGNVLAVEPTIASTVSFANQTINSMDINFAGGNGDGRIVVMKQGAVVTGIPVDATNYTSNTIFGSGAIFGSGEYVVYAGTGSTINVTGLKNNRIYHVAVFEYNDGGLITARNYLAIPGTGNAPTLPLNEGLEITASNTLFKIDFDNTVPRVNNGAFGGVGITTIPATGELNNNTFSINPTSFAGPTNFGNTLNTGGGVSPGNVTTGTFYAFEPSPGNRIFGIQPATTYCNPGNIAIRLQNSTGDTIKKLALSFKLYELNNDDNGYYTDYEFSTDNVSYGPLSIFSDTTLVTADISPAWRIHYKSCIKNNLSILPGDNFYLRLRCTFHFSSLPATDEIGLDDISFVANPTTVFPKVSGIVEDMTVFGPVQLSANTTVTGDVYLFGQNVELGNFDLTIGSNANVFTSGYLQTNGTGSVVLNNVTTNRLFPIGVTTYNPLTINNGNGLNWSARLSDGISNVLPPNNTNRAVLRTWTISPSTNPPPSGANLTFRYNDGDPAQIGVNFNPAEDVQVWHYNGSGWSAASGALAPTGTPGSSRTVTLNNWTQYSPFAISNLSGALPVALGLIKAKLVTGGIKVNWVNFTESNISRYIIERSLDGTSFNIIGQVNPILNNGEKAEYNWLDPFPSSGDNFYRVIAIENDGNKVYSMIVRISTGKQSPAISVYPSLITAGSATTQISNVPDGDYKIRLLSINGQELFRKPISLEGGSVTMPVQLPVGIKSGYYILSLEGNNIRLQSRIICQ